MSMPDLTKISGDPKAWARVILARHAAGERVRPISLQFAREALKEPKKDLTASPAVPMPAHLRKQPQANFQGEAAAPLQPHN